MDSQLYLLGDDGNIKFTRTGVQCLKPLFDLAGIDTNSIRTVHKYHQARIEASPFFMQHLSKRADGWSDTDQFRLLKAAVFGDGDDLEREIKRFDIKKNLQIIK